MIRRTALGYQVRWRDADGTQRKELLRGATREEAERRERELLRQRDLGQAALNPRSAPSFAAFSAAWTAERRGGWKHGTRVQYAQVLALHLMPVFGPLRVSVIDEGQVRRFLTRCVDEVKLSARRTNLTLFLLKGILRTASRRYGVDTSWLADIKTLRAPDADIDPLSPPEIAAVIETAQPWWQPLLTTMFWTGARPGELEALKWGDVDTRRRSFRVRAARNRGVEGTPKTKASNRDVAMLPTVVAAFEQQRAQQAAQRLKDGLGAAPAGQDYVWTGPQGALVDFNHLRARVAAGAPPGGAAAAHDLSDAPFLRQQRAGSRREPAVGRRDARAPEHAAAVRALREVDSQSHAAGRQRPGGAPRRRRQF